MAGAIQGADWKGKACARVSAAAMCLFISGCAAPPPTVTPQLAAFAPRGIALEALHRGRAVYTGACVACHGTDSPDAFEPERWRGIVSDMAERSHLKRQQEEDLVAYLLTARESVLHEKAHKASSKTAGF